MYKFGAHFEKKSIKLLASGIKEILSELILEWTLSIKVTIIDQTLKIVLRFEYRSYSTF